MITVLRASRAPRLDRIWKIPSMADRVVAIDREEGAALYRPPVVDQKGRKMTVPFEGAGDLVVVPHRAHASGAEARDGDRPIRIRREGRDDMVHCELDVPIAVLFDWPRRQIGRALMSDVEIDGAMRKDDIARAFEGILGVRAIEDAAMALAVRHPPRKRIGAEAVEDHIEVGETADLVIADPAAQKEDKDIVARR